MPYILLLSGSGDGGGLSRTFIEHETRDELVRMIIDYFENLLMEQQQAQTAEVENQDDDLTYTSEDLNEFIDSFSEMVCLERQGSDLWIPYATSWIKEALYLYLREQSDKTDKKGVDSMDVDMNAVNVQTYENLMV